MSYEAWGDDDDGLDGMREVYREALRQDGWLDDKQAEVLYIECERERQRFERLLQILMRIQSFIVGEHIRLPDGRVFEFKNPAIEHEMLYALSEAIRRVPDDIAAIQSDGAGSALVLLAPRTDKA